MIARSEIIRTAREYLGTPYHHIGRLKGVGVDCIGLLWCVARELSIPDAGHDLKSYSRQPDGVTLEREFTRALDRIAPSEVLCGDVLVFWIAKRGLITHAAIKSPVGLIHTHQGIGKVVEHGLDDRWQKRIGGAFRFRGVEDFYADPAPSPTPAGNPKQPAVRDCCGC